MFIQRKIIVSFHLLLLLLFAKWLVVLEEKELKIFPTKFFTCPSSVTYPVLFHRRLVQCLGTCIHINLTSSLGKKKINRLTCNLARWPHYWCSTDDGCIALQIKISTELAVVGHFTVTWLQTPLHRFYKCHRPQQDTQLLRKQRKDTN